MLKNTRCLSSSEDFIGYASGQAVADAQTYDHITLDYSIGSLKQVDEILGRVHEHYMKNPSSVSVRGLIGRIRRIRRGSDPPQRAERLLDS